MKGLKGGVQGGGKDSGREKGRGDNVRSEFYGEKGSLTSLERSKE